MVERGGATTRVMAVVVNGLECHRFHTGVKGDTSFRREVNDLEVVLGSRAEEEVRGCAAHWRAASSQRR
jgi:hypothetical protein